MYFLKKSSASVVSLHLQHIWIQTSLKLLNSHIGLLTTLLNGTKLDLPFPHLCLLSLTPLQYLFHSLQFLPRMGPCPRQEPWRIRLIVHRSCPASASQTSQCWLLHTPGSGKGQDHFYFQGLFSISFPMKI